MAFEMTDERRLLADMVARWATSDDAASPSKAWASMAELGLLGVPFAANDGGFEGGAVEIGIITEALGRSLVLAPFIPTVVLAGGALRHAGAPAQRAALIPRIIDGSLTAAFAHDENGRQGIAEIATTATSDDTGFRLNGGKSLVVGALQATHLLVTARGGGKSDRGGVSLFLIEKNLPGVTFRSFRTIDGGEACEVALDDVMVTREQLIGDEGCALPLIERIVHEAIVAQCAETVGVIRGMHEMAVEYAKVRKQFGKPIASFQVIQHRLVDMLIECEQAAALTASVANRLESLSAAERAPVVSALKTFTGQAQKAVGQAAVQVHGAMGVTDELPLGRYFKRAMVLDTLLGDANYHLRRYMTATGLCSEGAVKRA
jgi:alkylation response protein AidB-like acyl-CoA dehydrogenase